MPTNLTDCYERLAIGQRLNQKDVYRTAVSKTVADCQRECTQDEEKCRSFSFGIGVKGNATCEISSHVVKETIDLKPIGTSADTDYDLYIKKLGCKLVIEKNPSVFGTYDGYEVSEHPGPLSRPQTGLVNRPRPSHHDSGGLHYAQSLVSVSPGNNNILRPSYYETLGSAQSHLELHQDYGSNKSFGQDSYGGGLNDKSPYPHRIKQPNRPENENPHRPASDLSYGVQNSDAWDRPHGPNSGTINDDRYDGPDESSYGRPFDIPKPILDGPNNPYVPNKQNSVKPVHERPEDSRPPFRPTHLSFPYYNSHDDLYGGSSFRPANDHRPSGFERPHSTRPNYPGYFEVASRPYSPAYDDSHVNRRPGHGQGGGGGLYGRPTGGDRNQIPGVYSPKYPHQKPIISEAIGPNGQIITSIITEINNVCFRRAMAGRRVARPLVRRSMSCERVEDCQQECADEKHFVCEGFNYRLDPSGRGRGDCELLEIPYIRLDISRDIIHDPDCDYYEKDRNSSPDCKGRRPPSYRPQGGGSYLPGNEILPPLRPYGGNRPIYGDNRPISGRPSNRRPPGDVLPPYSGNRRPQPHAVDRFDGAGGYGDGYRYDQRNYGTNRGSYPPPPSDNGHYDGGPSHNRRGDFHQSYHSQDTYEDRYNFHSNNYHQYNDGHHYQGNSYISDNPDYKPPPYDYKSYEPYLPSYHLNYNPYRSDRNRYDDKFYRDRERDKHFWGLDKHDRGWGSYGGAYGDFGSRDGIHEHQNRNDVVHDGYNHGRYYGNQEQIGGSNDWGKYGGSYGTSGYDHFMNSYDYWGFNRRNDVNLYDGYVNKYDSPNIIPPHRNTPNEMGTYLPFPRRGPGNVHVPPGFGHNYVNDECSLRSVTGFRLYNGVVKKIFSVPSINECESLCFKETDFPCNSYAYRYTIGPSTDNCYLSDRNYKELDYYTDLEQDRDCDVYTMHNRKQCGQPLTLGRDDCFLLARSGQRLEQSCVKDSLNVASIVECQIECLKSSRFICRSFSYRYGLSPISGVIDNCQLTDLSYHDLNPRTDLVTEPGFVLYERRSFGRGCELLHFPIQGPIRPTDVPKPDELCYIGYTSPVKLLPEAARKLLRVENEFQCRSECTRCRQDTIFHCMSFSFRSAAPLGEPNCYLSDIYQRDLTEHIDYIRDENSWLFAWDHYNPKCYPLSYNEHVDHNTIANREEGYNISNFLYDNVYGLDTWKMYSVGGWPCKRGTCCRQDREIGFWFCELEGGSPSAWDYCCKPDHHCGYSKGYPYEWCYVGPRSTQWRKCNDRYYPYIRPITDRDDRPLVKPDTLHIKPYVPEEVIHPQLYPPLTDSGPPAKPHLADSNAYDGSQLTGGHREPRPWVTRHDGSNVLNNLQPPYRNNFRPDRPPAPPTRPPPSPSLNEYEKEFDHQFLDPPKPGGFGQPRHWPVSYLHKEKPPNVTTPFEQKFERMQAMKEPKLDAIQSLINIIKTNDLKNIQYQITNNSNKEDDVLFVQIPLPSNFTNDKKDSGDYKLSEPVDLLPPANLNATKLESVHKISRISNNTSAPYRKGHVMKTSVANHGRGLFDRTAEDDALF